MAVGAEVKNFEDVVSEFEKQFRTLILPPESSFFRSKKKKYNEEAVQESFVLLFERIQSLDGKPTYINFALVLEKIRVIFLSRVHEEQLSRYHKFFNDIQVQYNNYLRTLERTQLVKHADPLVPQYVQILHAAHAKSQIHAAAPPPDDDTHSYASGGSGGGAGAAAPAPARRSAPIFGTAAQQQAFSAMLNGLGAGEALEMQKAQVASNLTRFENFLKTATPAESNIALQFLQADAPYEDGIARLADANGFQKFLVDNACALYQATMHLSGQAIEAYVRADTQAERERLAAVASGGGGGGGGGSGAARAGTPVRRGSESSTSTGGASERKSSSGGGGGDGAAAPDPFPPAIATALNARTEAELHIICNNLKQIQGWLPAGRAAPAAAAAGGAAPEITEIERKQQLARAYLAKPEHFVPNGRFHPLTPATLADEGGFAAFIAMQGRVERLFAQYRGLLAASADAAALNTFFDTIKNFTLDQLAHAEANMVAIVAFVGAATPTRLSADVMAYFGDALHGRDRRQALGTEDSIKDFVKFHVAQLYGRMMQALEIENAVKIPVGESIALASPIHGISAGGWYHNKASDRDMQWSGLWDEVIRYSTGATSDAERQRMLSMEAARELNRLATDPSEAVPATFAELLRRVLAPQAVKSDGAGASEKTAVAKAIVIDREGEMVADDHPEFRAQLNTLSEAELSQISRNLSRMQQDLQTENAHQPFLQAFTRAYLALPTRIEKLTRINGYERYKVREAKAEALYGEYRRILNPPNTEALPPQFFNVLTQLETGSLLEQDRTLRQLEINLRQFAVFLEKETTPEDQRLFLRAYLQRETVISTLAHSSSFADFQTALGLRPSAPPKSAMRNEPAAVFAPAAASAASAPPLPAASAPPLPAHVVPQINRINAAQGAFLMADALAMPVAPSGGLAAASEPPLPMGVKHESGLVLG